jgi:transcriptional regulator with PAS, ATPase and Fis domain
MRTCTNPEEERAPPELASFLEGMPEPHILFDQNYRILAANKAYRRLFSPTESVVGRAMPSLTISMCPVIKRARVARWPSPERPVSENESFISITPHRANNMSASNWSRCQGLGKPSYYVEKMEPLRQARQPSVLSGLIGQSNAFRSMLELVSRVAPSDASVMLLGESGTGKELLARAVHEGSKRSARPFVVVDCASITESLLRVSSSDTRKGPLRGLMQLDPDWLKQRRGDFISGRIGRYSLGDAGQASSVIGKRNL